MATVLAILDFLENSVISPPAQITAMETDIASMVLVTANQGGPELNAPIKFAQPCALSTVCARMNRACARIMNTTVTIAH